jgi:phosphatidylserine/phosphatidylglycerophosphate/cardiolipin synthase-like enzyme
MKKIVVSILILFVSAAGEFGCAHHSHQYESRPRKPASGAPTALEDDDDSGADMSEPMGRNPRLFSSPVNLTRVTGVFNNSDTPTVAQLIRFARESIDIEIYEMADPEVRQALREALKKQVKVRIVKEPSPIGEKCNPWKQGLSGKSAKKASPEVVADCLDQQGLVSDVRAKGGAFEPFNKNQLCGQKFREGRCYQHGKIVIVDRNRKERLALISTGNFNSSNLCDLAYGPGTCNRDYTYITRDTAIIDTLSEIFEKDLDGKRYDLGSVLKSRGVESKLTVSPFSFEPLAELIRSARNRIQIQNQYINPDSGLVELLIEKARQGRDVEVMLADVCSFGKVPEKKAYNLYLMFAAMEAAGIKIRMFNKSHRIEGKDGYLHAKAVVIDGQRAWVGSVNGSAPSLNQNREFGLFFSHPARVRAFSEFIARDFSDPTAQPWRDSLRCHAVGYQSSQATRSDSGEYSTFIESLKAKQSGKVGDSDGEDDDS